MAESALRALAPLQRERLRALGIDLYELRPVTGVATGADDASPTRVHRLALVAEFDRASPPPLVSALLRALGLTLAETSERPDPAWPVLALGLPASEGTLRVELPSLAALRDARTKRAVWPRLRLLRRRLLAHAA